MVTLTVPQFLLVLVGVMALSMWLTAKMIIAACQSNATTLMHLLRSVYRKDPSVVGEALDLLKPRLLVNPPGYDPTCRCPEAPNCGAADFHRDECECVHCANHRVHGNK